MADNSISFLDVCKDVTKTATKIPTTDYLPIGKYKIFDQGKDYIGGFRDSAIGLASDMPYILFGDHTRIIKYIDEPCFIGADGVKLLKVKDSRYTSKYIYYAMKAQPIESQGYARHFKFLKEQFYKYTTIEKQKRIVAELDNIEEGIRVKQEQLKALDELIQSRFTEMFGNTAKNIIKKSLSVVCPIQAFGGDVESVNGKYWLLNLDAIESHTGYVLQEMYTSEIGSSTIKFSKDNVLYSKLRPYLNKVVIPNKSGYATSELVPFAPTKEINKYYFAYFLRSKAFVDYINANTNGARMPRASMDILKNFLIPVPPLPLQNQFAEFVQQVERAKEIVKIQIKDLQELLALKMDEYFQ